MTVKQRSNNLWCRLYMGEFKRFSNVTFTITQSIKNIRELFLKFGLILKMLCSNHTIWIFWLFCLKQCKEQKDVRPLRDLPDTSLPVCPLWMAPPMYQENTVCGRIVDDKVVHILKWKVFLKCTCWIETKVQWKKLKYLKNVLQNKNN